LAVEKGNDQLFKVRPKEKPRREKLGLFEGTAQARALVVTDVPIRVGFGTFEV
jgi:hypothetical protein